MTYPTFNEEKLLWSQGHRYIAGVDEVGRGCFAGPVVTAAVILPQNFTSPKPINDSKKLSAKVRQELAEVIKEKALAFSIIEIAVEKINTLGIGKAAQLGFRRAIKQLTLTPHYILIDAFYIKHLSRKNQKPIIGGDGIGISIAAASIIAKVYRDTRMKEIHPEFPHYDFATNKGYGTKKHQAAIKQYGLSSLHRTSFDLQKFT